MSCGIKYALQVVYSLIKLVELKLLIKLIHWYKIQPSLLKHTFHKVLLEIIQLLFIDFSCSSVNIPNILTSQDKNKVKNVKIAKIQSAYLYIYFCLLQFAAIQHIFSEQEGIWSWFNSLHCFSLQKIRVLRALTVCCCRALILSV